MKLRKSLSFQFAAQKASINEAPVFGLTLIWILACFLAFTGLGNLP